MPTAELSLPPLDPDDSDREALVQLARAGRAHALKALARGVALGRAMFGAKLVLLVQPM